MTLSEPAPVESAGSATGTPSDAPAQDASAPEVEPLLNRAARRAKAKQAAQPGHVGPQVGKTRQGKGPRSATKRPG